MIFIILKWLRWQQSRPSCLITLKISWSSIQTHLPQLLTLKVNYFFCPLYLNRKSSAIRFRWIWPNFHQLRNQLKDAQPDYLRYRKSNLLRKKLSQHPSAKPLSSNASSAASWCSLAFNLVDTCHGDTPVSRKSIVWNWWQGQSARSNETSSNRRKACFSN